MLTVTAFITSFIYLFYPYFTTQQHIIVPEFNNNKDYPVLLLEWQFYSSIVFVNLPICLLAVCVLTLMNVLVLPPTGAAVAGVYRVAGKDMAPLEALVFGVGQTALSVIISFSRILATL